MARTRPIRPLTGFEQLEDRTVPANLQITNVALLDGTGATVVSPVLGGKYQVKVDWISADLTAANSYTVRVAVDGVPLDTAVTGQAGASVAKTTTFNGWYAGTGSHTVTATLDVGGTVGETSEGDNVLSTNFSPSAPTGLPAGGFFWPMGGVNGRDYSIVNYVDVDPRSPNVSDYRGDSYSYDGHDAFDITLPNFARMDAGIPILASAAGTVTAVLNDQFDRDTGSASHPGNYIAVDHGNGWQTIYYHIAKSTALVKVGDAVVAGQPIALTGSSGNSSDAHLHFAVFYRGLPVETMFAPATYFAEPPIHQADQTPSVTDAATTNSDPSADLKERPDEVTRFPTSAAQPVWFWYRLTHWNAGETYLIKWYRPNGSLATTYNWTASSDGRYGAFTWVVNASTVSGSPGDWNVALEKNGVELVRKTFTVTTGAGTPELRLTQSSTYIISGRTTPIDFGSVAAGGTAPQLAFTIRNVGTAALNVSNLSLPPGYSLVGSFPSSVAAGGTATFTVQLNATGPGTKFGAIAFDSDDSDEGRFVFHVTGTVTGSAPSGTPVLTDTGALATLFRAGFGPVPIGPNLSVAGSGSFGGGNVTVAFSTPIAGDVYGVRNQGTGSGQIGVSGTTVTYGGTSIGTVSGGTGTPLVVTLNGNADLIAVRALLRNVTFTTTSALTTPRYVSFRVTDGTALTSAAVTRTVDPMATADVVSIAAVTPNPTPDAVNTIDVTFPAPLDLTTLTAADLVLTRNGGANLITPAVTVVSAGGSVYQITGLAGLTNVAGAYALTVNTTGIRSAGGVPGTSSTTTTWTNAPNRPTATIARGPSQSALANAGPIRFAVTFSEPVTGFGASDIRFNVGSITTGLNAAVTPNGSNGDAYFVDVTGMSVGGTVGISIVDAAAQSGSGGLSQTAATPANQLVTFDAFAPVTFFSPTAIGPTAAASTPVTVFFTEPVVGFDATDLQLTNATVTDFTTVSSQQYTFILRPQVEGAFGVAVTATDAAGNVSSPVALTGNYDTTRPTAAVVRVSAAQVVGTAAVFRVTFNEPIAAASFTSAALSFAGSTAPGALGASIAPSTGNSYLVSVVGMTGPGTVTATLVAGVVADLAGLTTATAAAADAAVTYTPPSPAVPAPAPPAAPAPFYSNAFMVGSLLVLQGSGVPGGMAVLQLPVGWNALFADVNGDGNGDLILMLPRQFILLNGMSGGVLAIVPF